MQIKTITYRRTKNLGNYNSETLEATAQINEDEEPTKTYHALREWVLEKLRSPAHADVDELDHY